MAAGDLDLNPKYVILGWSKVRPHFVVKGGKLWNKRVLREMKSGGMPDAPDQIRAEQNTPHQMRARAREEKSGGGVSAPPLKTEEKNTEKTAKSAQTAVATPAPAPDPQSRHHFNPPLDDAWEDFRDQAARVPGVRNADAYTLNIRSSYRERLGGEPWPQDCGCSWYVPGGTEPNLAQTDDEKREAALKKRDRELTEYIHSFKKDGISYGDALKVIQLPWKTERRLAGPASGLPEVIREPGVVG